MEHALSSFRSIWAEGHFVILAAANFRRLEKSVGCPHVRLFSQENFIPRLAPVFRRSHTPSDCPSPHNHHSSQFVPLCAEKNYRHYTGHWHYSQQGYIVCFGAVVDARDLTGTIPGTGTGSKTGTSTACVQTNAGESRRGCWRRGIGGRPCQGGQQARWPEEGWRCGQAGQQQEGAWATVAKPCWERYRVRGRGCACQGLGWREGWRRRRRRSRARGARARG